MPLDEEKSYAVGYGKPPAHTRFKKGRSGNPAGRPRGSKNFRTLIEAALDEKVQVIEDGRRRQISKREVIAQQLVNKSAGADLRATKILFDMFKEEGKTGLWKDGDDDHGGVLEQTDQVIIERALARRKVGDDE